MPADREGEYMNEPVISAKSQLDRPERRVLEENVCKMRDEAENDIDFRIREYYGCGNPEEAPDYLNAADLEVRGKLIDGIHREQGDRRDWETAVTLYVKGCAYTLINRLAAFRCMEVRGFLDRVVTRFREDGLTPAADPLVEDEFLGEHEAVAEAFRREGRRMAVAIEIVFDPQSPYCALDGELADALFGCLKTVCSLMDAVEDETWSADDVLGWVYEYYNLKDLPRVQRKANTSGGLDPEDVPAANQFYTPHWVVRMLTDNSLGKLYLEHRGTFQQTVDRQAELFSPEERKTRPVSPDAAPDIAELCTYLVPSEEAGKATDSLWKGGPEELRVIDPACGSGHFLLYAFDVLERIWWKERPKVDRAMVPSKILQHNLFGVDLDMRACQLAAFNLYLKARTRAEQEGAEDFQMPGVGIVCADVHLANLEGAPEIFEEVSGGSAAIREVLEDILASFESIEGLGSLLDVRGTLSKSFMEQERDLPLFSQQRDVHEIFEAIQIEVSKRNGTQSIRARDLRSFLKLLVVLSQDYDVALMNPPYGARSRIPTGVKKYIEEHYDYTPEFYINFFEVCDRLTKPNGRVGMLVPRSFLFKRSFEDFREDFFQGRGAFDFLAEFGLGVLDNATVRTVGTVVRTGIESDVDAVGEFFRLADLPTEQKEGAFLLAAYASERPGGIQRKYSKQLSEFRMIPGAPVSYWVPRKFRALFEAEFLLDSDNARESNRKSLGAVKQGLATGDDSRFLRYFWEVPDDDDWVPFAKGGEDTWMIPQVRLIVEWKSSGTSLKRFSGSVIRNEDFYFRPAVTFNGVKSDGRRFGVLHAHSTFAGKGPVIVPASDKEIDLFSLAAFQNSSLTTYLMLAQTPERMWEIGEVSRLPWDPALAKNSLLDEMSRAIASKILALRHFEPASPYYRGPLLLALLGKSETTSWHKAHPHRTLLAEVVQSTPTKVNAGSLAELATAAEEFRQTLQAEILQLEKQLDDVVFEHFGLTGEDREVVYSEIAIRTNDDPRTRSVEVPENSPGPPEDFEHLVKQMLAHLIGEIVVDDDDGVVPMSRESDDEEIELLSRLISKFHTLFGDDAPARLDEVDQLLGSRKSSNEPFPNLRSWLEHGLFTFHCAEFENTPVLWKLSTAPLIADSVGDAFPCIVGYHQTNHNLFATIRNRYLEKREKAFRAKRDTAKQRQGDAELPARERERWASEEARCKSGLEQLRGLRDAAAKLKQSHQREYLSDEDRRLANEVAGLITEFGARTSERLAVLDELYGVMNQEAFADHFSPTFMASVNRNRREWNDALEDLAEACRAYAGATDQPVPAHYYDLFVYIDKVLGTKHYASNGLFFMNYYFRKGKKFLEAEGELALEPHEQLLANLARETGADVALGEQIQKACKKLRKKIPSDWKTRALEEVMVAGWNPVKKHGVAINIEPLAREGIVPAIVQERVI